MNPSQSKQYQQIKQVLVLQQSSKYMAHSNKTKPRNHLTKKQLHYSVISLCKIKYISEH